MVHVQEFSSCAIKLKSKSHNEIDINHQIMPLNDADYSRIHQNAFFLHLSLPLCYTLATALTTEPAAVLINARLRIIRFDYF